MKKLLIGLIILVALFAIPMAVSAQTHPLSGTATISCNVGSFKAIYVNPDGSGHVAFLDLDPEAIHYDPSLGYNVPIGHTHTAGDGDIHVHASSTVAYQITVAGEQTDGKLHQYDPDGSACDTEEPIEPCYITDGAALTTEMKYEDTAVPTFANLIAWSKLGESPAILTSYDIYIAQLVYYGEKPLTSDHVYRNVFTFTIG